MTSEAMTTPAHRTGRTATRLDEIELEPTSGGKAAVTSWPMGLRNPRPNMLSEEFASYTAALSASRTTGDQS